MIICQKHYKYLQAYLQKLQTYKKIFNNPKVIKIPRGATTLSITTLNTKTFSIMALSIATSTQKGL